MIQGTSSDVGKSLICTALCRTLVNRGLKMAPFEVARWLELELNAVELLQWMKEWHHEK